MVRCPAKQVVLPYLDERCNGNCVAEVAICCLEDDHKAVYWFVCADCPTGINRAIPFFSWRPEEHLRPISVFRGLDLVLLDSYKLRNPFWIIQIPTNFTATCLVQNEIAITSYVQLFLEVNSFNALNSSCSQLSFIINSSNIRIVFWSITGLE